MVQKDTLSPLEKARLQFQPKLPKILNQIQSLSLTFSPKADLNPTILPFFPKSAAFSKTVSFIQSSFPHKPKKVGVLFSGGQAAGGHNVIWGLHQALLSLNQKSKLFGFLDGPKGLLENKWIELTEEKITPYRNQGGFDMLGSGRTKIETKEQFEVVKGVALQLGLDGIVIIGGDDSNTNAALLAEYFLQNGCETSVVGVPKTIDGDLKNEDIEISFGFDTASKTYSEIIGNIMRDALSAKKYYYFIKLMGRSASHLTLECALQTHPNIALISEEIAEQKKTLKQIVSEICDLIVEREKIEKNYGVFLIPEGVIEFVPEFQNELQSQISVERDPHGNIEVSKIDTERFFIELVKIELENRKKQGKYNGKFSAQPIFCGYEGRSAFPTNFDAQYCYTLGYVAALLIENRATGYICFVKNMHENVENWEIGGRLLASMMAMEKRSGKEKPVIAKSYVDLKGKIFKDFARNRKTWEIEDNYRYPGPIQFGVN